MKTGFNCKIKNRETGRKRDELELNNMSGKIIWVLAIMLTLVLVKIAGVGY